MFWKNKDDLLQVSTDGFHSNELINEIFFNSKVENCEFSEVGKTGIFIGNFLAGRPPQCWKLFDVVVNCSDEEFELMESLSYIFLNIPKGKKGGSKFLNSISKLLSFIKPFIIKKQKILVHSKHGNHYLLSR